MSRVLEEMKESTNDLVELSSVFKYELISENDIKEEILDGSFETNHNITELTPVKLEDQEYLYDIDVTIKEESLEPQQSTPIKLPVKNDLDATHDIQNDDCNTNIDITHPNVAGNVYEAIISNQIELTPAQTKKTVKKSKTRSPRKKRSVKKKDDVSFSCGFCFKFFASCKGLFSHMTLHCRNLRKAEGEKLERGKQINGCFSETAKSKSRKGFNKNSRNIQFKTVTHMLETVNNKIKTESKTSKRKTKQTKTHQCDECGQIFTFYNNLLRHKEKHARGRVICEYCHKDFNRKSYLQGHIKVVHLKIVSNDTVFMCTVCKKKLRSAYALRGHMRIHTGEKPFKCDVCKKKFSNKWNLQVHCKSKKNNCSFK